MRSHPTEKLDYIKILTYYNLYLYSYFLFLLPSKFLTKPLRVLEDKVNKTNKQNPYRFFLRLVQKETSLSGKNQKKTKKFQKSKSCRQLP